MGKTNALLYDTCLLMFVDKKQHMTHAIELCVFRHSSPKR